MAKKNKYSLSFTAASLRLNEMVKVAKSIVDVGATNLAMVKKSGVAFGSTKGSTSVREFREIKNRLEKLTPAQMKILIHGDLNVQKQIAFLSICKNYAFIKDFTVDVLREKVLVFNYQIHESDYKSFIDSKVQLHPELEQFSETTMKKAKQVMFRILEQSGIINNAVERVIQPQILQPEVVKAIVDDDPSWLKIFMISDMDIKQLI
jgi:hypothetical protein